MNPPNFAALRRGLAVAALGLTGLSPAQAGLVSGNWDPVFGAPLEGLSWQVRALLQVSNACLARPDGVYSDGDCAPANITVQSIRLRLFDNAVADPNNFDQVLVDTEPRTGITNFGGGQTVTQIRILGGQVAGIELAGSLLSGTLFSGSPDYSVPFAAAGNDFLLNFSVDAPTLTCVQCRANITDPFGPVNVVGSNAQLQQYLVSYTSEDTSAPKFADAQGNAVGLRLDGNGNPIPLPGTLPLLAAALGVLALRGRRAA